MNKYNIIEAPLDIKWDNFIDTSKYGTIFIKSYFIKSCSCSYKSYYCLKNEELRAAIIINTDEKENAGGFIIYSGIVYAPPKNKQNKSQILSEQLEIQEFIANELTIMHNTINMNLHPNIIDTRGFAWVNYGTNKPKYNITNQYTTYLNIKDFINPDDIDSISAYQNSSSSRRQQIRYAKKKNYFTKIETDINIFLDFYKKTLKRQAIEIPYEYLENMYSLINTLISQKQAKIFGTYDDKKELSSMAVFSWDNKKAYYLYGASDPNKRNGHSGTAVIWDSLFELNTMGINEVDLEGVNSPYRGWFKLSFGGNLIPYYNVSYNSHKGNNNE